MLDGLGLSSFAESVLETARNVLQVFHSASSSGASALGLLTPVKLSDLLAGISARCAYLLLDMERFLIAANAKSMSLARALTKTRSSLSLK